MDKKKIKTSKIEKEKTLSKIAYVNQYEHNSQICLQIAIKRIKKKKKMVKRKINWIENMHDLCTFQKESKKAKKKLF